MRLVLLLGLLSLLIPDLTEGAGSNAPPCYSNGYTQVYRDWASGNFTSDLYLPETFLEKYVCYDLGPNQTQLRVRFLALLEAENITCRGDLCHSMYGNFGCPSGNSQECWNVEHIIDARNSIFPNMSKNIVGNLVMAYGRWNQQLGNLRWMAVETEKRTVYGDRMVDAALINIVRCSDIQRIAGSAEVQDDPWWSEYMELLKRQDTSTLVGYGLGIPVLVVMFVLIGMAFRYGKSFHSTVTEVVDERELLDTFDVEEGLEEGLEEVPE